jgi:hypothetical protein
MPLTRRVRVIHDDVILRNVGNQREGSMKKMLVLIICISLPLLCLGCGGSKDVSGKYVSSKGLTIELTPEGKATLTSGGTKIEILYKVEGNTVKLFAKGREKRAAKLEIKNKDLIEPKLGTRFVKQ